AADDFAGRGGGALTLADDRVDGLFRGGDVGDGDNPRDRIRGYLIAPRSGEGAIAQVGDDGPDLQVELADGHRLVGGRGQGLELQWVLRLLDDHEDLLDQVPRERCEPDAEAFFHRSRQRTGVMRNNRGRIEYRGPAEGVDEVGDRGEVTHLLVNDRPDDPGGGGIGAAGPQRPHGVQVGRDRGVFQLEGDLKSGEHGAGVVGLEQSADLRTDSEYDRPPQ